MKKSSKTRVEKRRRALSSRSEGGDFTAINQRPVDDIPRDLFYQPHTISLLVVVVAGLLYLCFIRDQNASVEDNHKVGMQTTVFFFLIISMLAFPNGPFTWPHPALWRCVLGLSVLYMLLLVFIAFQDYKTARGMFELFYPELKNFTIDTEEGTWGEDCYDISSQIDLFCFSHFAGSALKALIVRHYGIVWTITIMWEITELCFRHLLPILDECLWDSVILDALIFNGCGIWFGMSFCNWNGMRYYRWNSIKDIRTTSGKRRRLALHFTPSSWSAVRWMEPSPATKRTLAVCQLVLLSQVTELNTFFLIEVFQIPLKHPLVFARLFLVLPTLLPSISQYYTYVTDQRCERMGTQCWVSILILLLESVICIKFGETVFAHTDPFTIALWFVVMVAGSACFMYVSAELQNRAER